MSKEYKKFIFPKWLNKINLYLGMGGILTLSFVVFVFWYWFSPKNLNVGYSPKQPVNYSHQLHAGELGIDCRYCHYTVEKSKSASVPATEICMNCHNQIQTDHPEVKKVIDSYNSNTPIDWVKVHQLPDYSYFNHSAHVNAGVSCVSCHGRVDQMNVVHQVESLSMGWCLECHRNPEKYIRPKEMVTKLDWKPENQLEMGRKLKEMHDINPGENCTVCHR